MNKIEALKKDLIQITEVSSKEIFGIQTDINCLLYTSPSPRD